MATTRTRRAGATGLAVVVAAVIAIGGVALADGGNDTPAPSATAATDRADVGTPAADAGTGDSGQPRGTVVFDRSGTDLPGAAVLDRCSADGRSAVAEYDTAALGTVVMQCGNQSQGYEHIRVRHTADWRDVLRGHGSRDWDDVMLTAVQTVLTEPQGGFPVDAGDGKVCYAAPIRFDDGSAPAEPYVKVIVSATTDRVITAYPTNRSDC